MSRPLRIEYPGAYYHVMNRGRGRQAIFADRADYLRFTDLMQEIGRMWSVRIHAYSLLPNHYHLLIETPQGQLSRALRHLDGLYTQRYNRAHRTDGPLFRGRYKAILVDADSYLLQLVRYIHLNPVEARLVRDASLHPWTSHRFYLEPSRPPVLLTTDAVLARFAHNRTEARKRYQAFIAEGVDEETQGLYRRGNWPAIWGSEPFREKMRAVELHDEIPQSKGERPRATLNQIEHAICTGYRIDRERLRVKRRGRWNEPRNVAIYLARERWGYALKEIGSAWGGLKYSSISSMVYAVKRRLDSSPALVATVARIERAMVKRQT